MSCDGSGGSASPWIKRRCAADGGCGEEERAVNGVDSDRGSSTNTPPTLNVASLPIATVMVTMTKELESIRITRLLLEAFS